MFNQKCAAVVSNGELHLRIGIETLCTDIEPCNATMEFNRQVTGENYAKMIAEYLNSSRDPGEERRAPDPGNEAEGRQPDSGFEGRPPGPSRLHELLENAANEAIACHWSGPKK